MGSDSTGPTFVTPENIVIGHFLLLLWGLFVVVVGKGRGSSWLGAT